MSKLSGLNQVRVDKSQRPDVLIVWPGLEDAFKKIAAVPDYQNGLWYLMTPYSLYAAGKSEAWKHAVRVTSSLAVSGLIPFSPIATWHPAQRVSAGLLEGGDPAFWLGVNRPFMEAAIGGLVAMLPGWEKSEGIQREIAVMSAMRKPIIQLPIPDRLLAA